MSQHVSMIVFIIFIILVVAYIAWIVFAYVDDKFPFTAFEANIPTGGCDVMGPSTPLTPDQRDARKTLSVNFSQNAANIQTLVPLPGIKC